MTRYTQDDLRKTAQWALQTVRCPERQCRVTLKAYDLCIQDNTNVALHIRGECKRHKVTVHTNCAI